MLRRICLALLIALIYSSCSKDSIAPKYDVTVPVTVPPCDTNALSWNHIIKNDIIIPRCANQTGCHVPGENNYDFKQYAVVADRIRSGRFTERIYLPVSHPLHMPVGTSMTPCEIAQLMTWINNGFPEN